MMRNMDSWARDVRIQTERQAMPIMTYPGLPLVGLNVMDIVTSGEQQARCIAALAGAYRSLAALTLMDLSVEAEAFGCPIQYSADEVPTVTGAILHDLEQVEALPLPSPETGRTAAYLEAARRAAALIEDRPLFGGMIGPYSLAVRLRDMSQLMLDLMLQPERVHALLEHVTRFLIAYARGFRAAGANGLVIAEPAAGLLSPAHCDEFSSAYVRRIVAAVQDEEFLVVLHNCGRTRELVPSLVSTGAGMLHFGNAVDMLDILPQVPRDVLAAGNIDPSSVFRHGKPEQVRSATLALLRRTADYPNFVLSSGCDVPPGTPLQNIDAFYGALDEFNGRRGEATLADIG